MLVCSVSCRCSSSRSSSFSAVLLEGGVVDQDVEPAECLRRVALDRALAERGVLDVAGDGEAAAALASRPRRSVSSRVLVLRPGRRMRDVGAFAREQHRDRAADAGIAAGDDRDACPRACRCRGSRAPGSAAAGRVRVPCPACAGAARGMRILRLPARAGLHRLSCRCLLRRRLGLLASFASIFFWIARCFGAVAAAFDAGFFSFAMSVSSHLHKTPGCGHPGRSERDGPLR